MLFKHHWGRILIGPLAAFDFAFRYNRSAALVSDFLAPQPAQTEPLAQSRPSPLCRSRARPVFHFGQRSKVK